MRHIKYRLKIRIESELVVLKLIECQSTAVYARLFKYLQ
jgi:hypothetical protein